MQYTVQYTAQRSTTMHCTLLILTPLLIHDHTYNTLYCLPVFVSERREVRIVMRGVGNIAHKQQNVLEIFLPPRGVVFSYHGCCVDVIAVVEVVVVIVTYTTT